MVLYRIRVRGMGLLLLLLWELLWIGSGMDELREWRRREGGKEGRRGGEKEEEGGKKEDREDGGGGRGVGKWRDGRRGRSTKGGMAWIGRKR